MPNLTYLHDVPIDGYIQVTGDEARQAARLLATKEGIFGGFSSGANLAAALKLLDGEMAGKTIAIMMCDSGLKYLSHRPMGRHLTGSTSKSITTSADHDTSQGPARTEQQRPFHLDPGSSPLDTYVKDT